MSKRYFVSWDMRSKKPKHFGTVVISDNYLVLYDKNTKGLSATVQYDSGPGLRIVEGSKSVIKLPNGLIKFEVLTEEEFDEKYDGGLNTIYKD